MTEFLENRNENLAFTHGEFRKNIKLSMKQQDFIRESVEEYFNRFYSVVDVLGEKFFIRYYLHIRSIYPQIRKRMLWL